MNAWGAMATGLLMVAGSTWVLALAGEPQSEWFWCEVVGEETVCE